MKKIALLGLLLTLPAAGAIRPDQAVAPVQFGAAPANQTYVRTASDGANFYSVWRVSTASGALIVGGRLSPEGEALDRPSVILASGEGNSLGYPDVVFAGDHFLVAYPLNASIQVRRVGRDGQVSPDAVVAGSGTLAILATNGRTVLLATARNRIRLLSSDGVPIGVERDVPNAGGGKFEIGSNGDRYLLAYSSNAAGLLQGTLVLLGSNGDVLLSKPITLPDTLFPRSVSVASNGSSFLLSVATNGPVYCMVVDGEGNAGTPRSLDNQSGNFVAATWAAPEYTLVWSRTLSTPSSVTGHDIVGVRVDAAGVPLDTTLVKIASLPSGRYGEALASASNGRDTILVTADHDGNFADWHTSADILSSLAQIDAEPARRRHVAIGSAAPEQTGGSMASNGTLSLVAWRERSGLDPAVIRAAFLAADGQIGPSMEIGDADPGSTTAMASNGRDFLVVYFDSRWRLVARRITLEGRLDSTPIVITPYGTPSDDIAVGWSGQKYVAVTASYGNVSFTGIGEDGTVNVGVPLPPMAIQLADTPSVSCSGGGCSATWHLASPPCYVLCPYVENNVFARTDAAGNVLWHVVLTDSAGVTPAVSVADAEGRSLYVYASGKTLFAGRITAGGTVLDPPTVNGGFGVISTPAPFSPMPIGTVRGGLYWVDRSSSTQGRLYWSRIDPEPRPHVGAFVFTQEYVDLPLTLTASARNTYLLSSRGVDDPGLLASRLFVRTIASPDPGTSSPRRRATR